MLCACGCGLEVKEGNRFIHGHNSRVDGNRPPSALGRIVSEETRRKLSIANSGNVNSEEARKKMSDAHTGKKLSDNHRQRISEGHIGHPVSEKTREKIAMAQRGEKGNMYGKCGDKHHNYGKLHSDETRRRMSATQQGISYEDWESFAQESTYCPKFDETCRESNREKYDRRCFLCDLVEDENLTRNGVKWKLSVHHVDMDKQQGCDGIRWKLVPLCIQCHGKVHNELWMQRIIKILTLA